MPSGSWGENLGDSRNIHLLHSFILHELSRDSWLHSAPKWYSPSSVSPEENNLFPASAGTSPQGVAWPVSQVLLLRRWPGWTWVAALSSAWEQCLNWQTPGAKGVKRGQLSRSGEQELGKPEEWLLPMCCGG